jgi:hypothetical protein
MIRIGLTAFSLFLLGFIIFPQFSVGQSRRSQIIKYDTAAYEGKVVLTDNEELTGRIIFNDNDGIVTVTRGTESQSFNAKRVLMFEYHVRETGRNKLFYSLDYTDPETGARDFYFFEVLKQLESFAVLAKIDRIKTEARKGPLNPVSSPLLTDRKKTTQTQTVYFLNSNGDFQPYLKILEKEIDGDILDINETHNYYINSKLFEDYTGKHFQYLAEFADLNRLSFKQKSGIIAILDKYEELLNND